MSAEQPTIIENIEPDGRGVIFGEPNNNNVMAIIYGISTTTSAQCIEAILSLNSDEGLFPQAQELLSALLRRYIQLRKIGDYDVGEIIIKDPLHVETQLGPRINAYFTAFLDLQVEQSGG